MKPWQTARGERSERGGKRTSACGKKKEPGEKQHTDEGNERESQRKVRALLVKDPATE